MEGAIDRQEVKEEISFMLKESIEKPDNREADKALFFLLNEFINDLMDVFTVIKGNCQLSLKEVCEKHRSLNENLNIILKVSKRGELLVKKLDALIGILEEIEWNFGRV